MTDKIIMGLENPKAVYILLLILTLVSSVLVCKEVIIPHVDARIQFENDVLNNQMEPPYQYRVLKPLIARALQILLSGIIDSVKTRHVLSYSMIVFFCFLGIYYFFYMYLRYLFSNKTSIIGLLLLQTVIPLSITGYYMIGDFITLLFYLVGFSLFFSNKDRYFPILIGLATLNREQIVFLLLFYVFYLFYRGQLFDKRKILIIIACVTAFLVAFIGVRIYFGLKISQYTIALHVARNTELKRLFLQIIPLWFAEIAGFVLISILAFKKSNLFFKLSFISLGLYVLLFFLKGNLWELAKFLPAFLIMIPMSLQVLTGELANESNIKPLGKTIH
ncbi:MAG: hypothetical protein B6D58_05155 [candidate division Zixibacteria bacterium 4484_95]|nr:MAG: hypothetical protein B6D58_05155 [candidate division Zixibacteria bacterium 4484_95]